MLNRSLIVDANNLLYRTFFANINEKEHDIIGLAHHSALWTMNKYYKEYPADEFVMVFDSYSWRKLYTKDLTECVTHKKYKGHRRQNLTTSQEEKLKNFDAHINEFAEIMRTQTSILVLKEKYLEADDLIAGYIQSHPDTTHVLVSSDKDYMQLLEKNKLSLIDPDSGKPRSLKEWNDDPNLFMFEKCLRGDTSDNIISAYPRLRTKKIKEAYNDEYAREAIMNHEFPVLVNQDDGTIIEKKYITREVYEENQYLMSLEAQPENIRALMLSSITNARSMRAKFNYSAFLKFCGRHELNTIMEKIDNFVPMLAGKIVR